MKTGEIQVILMLICLMFVVIGAASYIAGYDYPLLWMAAFISLVATVLIDVIERVEIKHDCDFNCSECPRCPSNLKEQTN